MNYKIIKKTPVPEVVQFEFVIPSVARNLAGFLVANAPRNDKRSHYQDEVITARITQP